MGAVNSYDEYGIPAVANSGRFQYAGQIWIPEIGMYHYKARVYSPTLGRFLQTDPIGYDDQYNLYAYVGNDPLNRGDPTGTAAEGDPLTPTEERTSSLALDFVQGTLDNIASAAEETGATARDVAPVRRLARAVPGVGGVITYTSMRNEGRSRTAAAAGAAANEGTGALIGGIVGSLIEPGGGTIVGALIGGGVDEVFGVGDAAGEATAEGVTWTERGGIGRTVSRLASEVIRRTNRRSSEEHGSPYGN